MIAFVGSSMANTSEIKEVEASDFKRIVFQKEQLASPIIWLTRCDIIYIRNLAIAVEQGFTKEEAADIASGAFKVCVEIEEKKEGIQQN